MLVIGLEYLNKEDVFLKECLDKQQISIPQTLLTFCFTFDFRKLKAQIVNCF